MSDPTTPDVVPWLERLSAPLRAEYEAGRAQRVNWADLDEAERARRDAEARRAALLEHWDFRAQTRWATWCAGVPERYRDRSAAVGREENTTHWLRNLDPVHQHRDAVAAWLSSDSETLMLVGETGTGKTTIAIAAGYAAAGAGTDVRFVSHLDYLLALRPGGSDNPGRERDLAARASLLAIDDLGAEADTANGGSRFVREETCALLDRRLANGLRQIVTTNLTPPELADALGPRIVSRLMEGMTALDVTGPDRRLARIRPTWV